MLIGFLGGTFDPVHRGHLHLAECVLKHTAVEAVHMVLAARPGHRQSPAASVEHRWAMLKLACDDKSLVADDIELTRDGPSFTVDTLLQYRIRQPDWVPCWILGWDAFATLHLWHRWREVMDLCNLIVVQRPGQAAQAELPAEIRTLCHQHETQTLSTDRTGQILRLAHQMLDISATQVRAAIREHRPCEDLLVEPVNAYIMEHRLYAN